MTVIAWDGYTLASDKQSTHGGTACPTKKVFKVMRDWRECGALMKLIDVYSYPNACEILYSLLRERSTEDDPYVNISHRHLPSRKEHQKFFDARRYRAWYMIVVDECLLEEQAVGYVSLTSRNEIGIVLFGEHRGKGYGLEAVNLLLQKHKPLPAVPSVRSGRFLANINPKNDRSIRLFTRLGFTQKQVTYEL